MNHVSISWLRRIRWALIAYDALLLVGYLVVAFGMGKGMHGAFGFTPILVGIVVVQFLFEGITTNAFQDKYWVKTTISYYFAVIATAVVAMGTGMYQSPFLIALFGLIFLSAAINAFLGPSVVVLVIVGFLLDYFDVIAIQSKLMNGIGSILLSTFFAVTGYFFWRNYFAAKDSSVDALHSSLSNEQAKSDIILKTIEDGVVLIDNSMIIRLFNPGASNISGWLADEAVNLNVNSVINLVNEKGEPYSPEQNPFAQAIKDKKTVRDNKAVLVSRSNKQIALTISASPLFDDKNNVTGVVGVFRDVSKERSEEQRRAEFISTASHEMRTPVAAIEGYLALALNERVSQIDSKARGYLEKAHASTKHLGDLFQDLLTSAKAEDGRLSNHPQVVEMGEYLEKLTDDLRFGAQKKGLNMEFTLGSHGQVVDASSQLNTTVAGSKVIRPLYYVNVDPDRLREVITNLFDNAVKYTEAGSISIGLTGDDKVVQMFISDTGPGIPQEDISHLFQKFYRVDSSATRTIGGTGLGLFICRKIIELYNGRIWVESELNKGSTFFINLPRMSTQKATQLQAQSANTPPLSGA